MEIKILRGHEIKREEIILFNAVYKKCGWGI